MRPLREERQEGRWLNHEDCKVAGLQRSRSGEATGTIDMRRNDPSGWVFLDMLSHSIQSFDVGERPSVQMKVCLPPSFLNVIKMLMSWRTERQIMEGNLEYSSFK